MGEAAPICQTRWGSRRRGASGRESVTSCTNVDHNTWRWCNGLQIKRPVEQIARIGVVPQLFLPTPLSSSPTYLTVYFTTCRWEANKSWVGRYWNAMSSPFYDVLICNVRRGLFGRKKKKEQHSYILMFRNPFIRIVIWKRPLKGTLSDVRIGNAVSK